MKLIFLDSLAGSNISVQNSWDDTISGPHLLALIVIKLVRELLRFFLLCPYPYIIKSSQNFLKIFSPIIAAQNTSYSIYNYSSSWNNYYKSNGIQGNPYCYKLSLASNLNSVFFSYPYGGQKNTNSPMPVTTVFLFDLCLLRSHQSF